MGLDPRQRAGSLSGGQRAQLALTLALAKRPELLILDEPVASLDPLARREFLLVPAIIGTFWAAPLLTREFEAGTYQLAWTQSVTRTRWLAARRGVGALAAMATAGLFSLLLTWWSGPIDTAAPFGERNSSMTGDWTLSTQNIDPAGHPFNVKNVSACQGNAPQACNRALSSLHLRAVITYQPAGRFWALQRAETGAFLAAALMLAGFCFWSIRRRRLSRC